MITYTNTYQPENLELINGEVNKESFNNLESLLNKDKKNVHICLVNDKNKDLCRGNKNYLVKESIILNLNNLIDIKSKIESGSIILITENAKAEDVNLLIKQINYQGLKIIPLSELISESVQ